MGEIVVKRIDAVGQRARRNGAVTSIVLHSTDGRVAGDVPTLTQSPNVSVHFYITRAGRVYQFVPTSRCAYHAGKVDKPTHDNDHTVGIEMEHFDGREDWPDVQVKMAARLIAFLRQKFGYLPVVSHAAVATSKMYGGVYGRKQDPLGFPWQSLARHHLEAKEETWKVVQARDE